MPLVCTRVGIVYDHAVIAIAVGNVKFIGFLIDKGLSRKPEVIGIVASFGLAWFADLHQKFSVLRKLQNHVVIKIAA